MTTDDEKEVAYYVASVPWKDCPFHLQLVVWTTEGKEDAVRIFREFYQNPNLEITDAFEITVIRADMFEELKNKGKVLDN